MTRESGHPLADDLEHVLDHTRGLWEELRGQRIFITGGTGFVGCWLLETFAWANRHLALQAQAVVLSRNPAAFARKAPHLAKCAAIRFQSGDVVSFDHPQGAFSHVIHAATEVAGTHPQQDSLELLDSIVEGTRRVLEFSRACGAKKVLLTSSGAVYGTQPVDVPNVPEEYAGAPDLTSANAPYGEGKRVAELLWRLYGRRYAIEPKIARCFAFVGPYLPLHGNFAVGNFVRDAMAGGPIVISGDGTPYRSYLYAADLAVWLWTILLKGAAGRPYNVGAEEPTSVAETAQAVAECFKPQPGIRIARQSMPGVLPARYVPSTERARRELGVRQTVKFSTALRKTIAWHQAAGEACAETQREGIA